MFFFFTFLTELTEQTVSCRCKKFFYFDTRPFPSLSFESIQTEKESSMLDLYYVPGNYSSLLIIMRSRQREMWHLWWREWIPTDGDDDRDDVSRAERFPRRKLVCALSAVGARWFWISGIAASPWDALRNDKHIYRALSPGIWSCALLICLSRFLPSSFFLSFFFFCSSFNRDEKSLIMPGIALLPLFLPTISWGMETQLKRTCLLQS